jgi:hypothetical protein
VEAGTGIEAAAPESGPEAGPPDADATAAAEPRPEASAPEAAPPDVTPPKDVKAEATADARDAAGAWTCTVGNPPVDCALDRGRAYCTEARVCTRCPVSEWLDCNNDGRDACETFVSDQNCGACGNACIPGVTRCVGESQPQGGTFHSCKRIGDGG